MPVLMLHLYELVNQPWLTGDLCYQYVCRWCGQKLMVFGAVHPQLYDQAFCPMGMTMQPPALSPADLKALVVPTERMPPVSVFICSHGWRHEECPECVRDDCPCPTCKPLEPFIDF